LYFLGNEDEQFSVLEDLDAGKFNVSLLKDILDNKVKTWGELGIPPAGQVSCVRANLTEKPASQELPTDITKPSGVEIPTLQTEVAAQAPATKTPKEAVRDLVAMPENPAGLESTGASDSTSKARDGKVSLDALKRIIGADNPQLCRLEYELAFATDFFMPDGYEAALKCLEQAGIKTVQSTVENDLYSLRNIIVYFNGSDRDREEIEEETRSEHPDPNAYLIKHILKEEASWGDLGIAITPESLEKVISTRTRKPREKGEVMKKLLKPEDLEGRGISPSRIGIMRVMCPYLNDDLSYKQHGKTDEIREALDRAGLASSLASIGFAKRDFKDAGIKLSMLDPEYFPFSAIITPGNGKAKDEPENKPLITFDEFREMVLTVTADRFLKEIPLLNDNLTFKDEKKAKKVFMQNEIPYVAVEFDIQAVKKAGITSLTQLDISTFIHKSDTSKPDLQPPGKPDAQPILPPAAPLTRAELIEKGVFGATLERLRIASHFMNQDLSFKRGEKNNAAAALEKFGFDLDGISGDREVLAKIGVTSLDQMDISTFPITPHYPDVFPEEYRKEQETSWLAKYGDDIFAKPLAELDEKIQDFDRRILELTQERDKYQAVKAKVLEAQKAYRETIPQKP
jgi:hypothetical protein